jgi:hypothetical protein
MISLLQGRLRHCHSALYPMGWPTSPGLLLIRNPLICVCQSVFPSSVVRIVVTALDRIQGNDKNKVWPSFRALYEGDLT